MTTTWTRINQKLDLFLGDARKTVAESGEARPRIFPESLRVEGWNWAQGVFCAHTPRKRQMTLVIDRDKRTAILPDDFYAVEGIYDQMENRWWRPMRRRPGDIRYDNDDLEEFWVWDNTMYLETTVAHDTDRLDLLYWAYWPDIEYTTGNNIGTEQKPVYQLEITQHQVHTPRWAESALLHLTTAFCWMPGMVEAGNLNEWKISIDSGTPMHNPRQAAARENLFWYHSILDKFPPARGRVE